MDDKHVGLRLDGRRADKLSRLAKATGRSQSAVMRLLIDQAASTGAPDIIIDELTNSWLNEQLTTILGYKETET